MSFRYLFVAALATGSGAFAGMTQVAPSSYDMLNGEASAGAYWDDSYNGNGSNTTSGAALSGGLGDLTDGVIATQFWFSNPGPYVGWNTIVPVITFHFDQVIDFGDIVFHFEDSNGFGGVAPPSQVRIEGSSTTLDAFVTDPADGAPFGFTFDAHGITSDTLVVTLFDGAGNWVFLSEVEFFAVPSPGAGVLAIALAGFGVRRRRG